MRDEQRILNKAVERTIRKLRIRRGLSQRQMAAQVGMSPGYLAALERGEATLLTPDDMRRLRSGLG